MAMNKHLCSIGGKKKRRERVCVYDSVVLVNTDL